MISTLALEEYYLNGGSTWKLYEACPLPIPVEKEKTEMMSNLEKTQLEWLKRNMGLTGKLDRIATALEKLSTIFGSDIDKLAELIKDADSKEQCNACPPQEEDKEDD